MRQLPKRFTKCSGRDRNRGTAAAELGILLPLLALLAFGATDFARVFSQTMTTAQAAEAGALYGSQTKENVTDYAKMIQIAATGVSSIKDKSLPDAPSPTAIAGGMAQTFGDVTIKAKTECRCASAPNTTISCGSGSCNAPSTREYVVVEVSKPFDTLFPYPGVPSSVALKRTVRMRAK